METLLIGIGASAVVAFVFWASGLEELELRLKFARDRKPPKQLDD